MAEFTVSEAQLVSLFLASVFYGIYFSTFCDCLRALVWNGSSFKATTNVKWILLIVAILMFVCSTADAIFNLEHNLNAFIFYDGPGGAAAHFHIINDWVNIARGITFLLITLLGDGMLIYRCWMVWERKWWIVILPLMIYVTVGVSFAAVPYVEAHFEGGSATLTARSINVWTTASCVTTFVLNIITTSLIAYRVWSVSRRTNAKSARAGVGPTPLEQALRIIIESGVIYTASVCILLGTSLAKNNAIYPISHVVRQIAGITFNLIIIRVDWLRQAGTSTHSHGSKNPIPLHFVSHRQGNGQAVSAPAVEVTVSRHVDYDEDSETAKDPGSSRGKVEHGWAQ